MALPSPSKPLRTPSSPNLLAQAISQSLTNLRTQTLPRLRAQTPFSFSLPLSRLPPSSHRRLLLILLSFLVLLPLLFRAPASPQTPRERLQLAVTLASQPGNTRAKALAAALRSWRSGYPPSAVLAAGAACTPRDAADAALRAAAPFAGGLRRFGVVDVGAGTGIPITKLALATGPRWLLAVEPHPALFKQLASLRRNGVKFLPVQAAVSDEAGQRKMLFREGMGACFDCVSPNKTGVRAEDVQTHTLDDLVLDGKLGQLDDARIALISVSAAGHEGRVLKGAQRLLGVGNVLYARVAFETGVGRDEALTTIREVLGAGLHCVPLGFEGVRAEEKNVDRFPMFGEAVTWRSADMFYQFVNATGRRTDLLCAKRAG